MSDFISEDEAQKNKILNYMDKNGNFYILGEFDETISENVVPNLVKKMFLATKASISKFKNNIIALYHFKTANSNKVMNIIPTVIKKSMKSPAI